MKLKEAIEPYQDGDIPTEDMLIAIKVTTTMIAHYESGEPDLDKMMVVNELSNARDTMLGVYQVWQTDQVDKG